MSEVFYIFSTKDEDYGHPTHSISMDEVRARIASINIGKQELLGTSSIYPQDLNYRGVADFLVKGFLSEVVSHEPELTFTYKTHLKDLEIFIGTHITALDRYFAPKGATILDVLREAGYEDYYSDVTIPDVTRTPLKSNASKLAAYRFLNSLADKARELHGHQPIGDLTDDQIKGLAPIDTSVVRGIPSTPTSTQPQTQSQGGRPTVHIPTPPPEPVQVAPVEVPPPAPAVTPTATTSTITATTTTTLTVPNDLLKLVRVNVTCLDPMKKEYLGEIFTVGNDVIGSVRKYIPFNTTDGWHVPKIILDQLKEKECQIFNTIKDDRGNNIRTGKTIKAYVIQELPPLSEEELKELAKVQQAQGI